MQNVSMCGRLIVFRYYIAAFEKAYPGTIWTPVLDNEKIVAEMESVQSENNILKILKEREFLHTIPPFVLKYFNLTLIGKLYMIAATLQKFAFAVFIENYKMTIAKLIKNSV